MSSETVRRLRGEVREHLAIAATARRLGEHGEADEHQTIALRKQGLVKRLTFGKREFRRRRAA